MSTATRATYERLRADNIDLSLAALPDAELYAVGFEEGYAVDPRVRRPYLSRRERSYVLGHGNGRHQRRIDEAIELADPYSPRSRERAAEARLGGRLIRQQLFVRYASALPRDGRFVWRRMLAYEAPMADSATKTAIFTVVRNRMTGDFTPYLWRWANTLPIDAPAWPIYRAAIR